MGGSRPPFPPAPVPPDAGSRPQTGRVIPSLAVTPLGRLASSPGPVSPGCGLARNRWRSLAQLLGPLGASGRIPPAEYPPMRPRRKPVVVARCPVVTGRLAPFPAPPPDAAPPPNPEWRLLMPLLRPRWRLAPAPRPHPDAAPPANRRVAVPCLGLYASGAVAPYPSVRALVAQTPMRLHRKPLRGDPLAGPGRPRSALVPSGATVVLVRCRLMRNSLALEKSANFLSFLAICSSYYQF